MLNKSEFAIATSQAQNPILFKLNYYSIYRLKLLLYLPLSLLVTPWEIYYLSITDFWRYFCFLYKSKLYVFTFKILVIFWFNNSLASPTFTFNSESLQYFLPRLIMVDFFCLKTKCTSGLWYFFNQWDRKILWNSLSAVIQIF